MKYDMMDWFYPMRFLVGECLQNNVLPVWNPYTNLGYPLHTDPQSGALYPIVWGLGYLFGYSLYTLHIEYMLHIVLAFYGMKKLAEAIGIEGNIALVIGLSYACCGFFISNAQHLSWIIAATWIPYVACYYFRLVQKNNSRDALCLSVFSSLLLTGGYPAFTITMFYLMGLAFVIQIGKQLWQRHFLAAKTFFLNNCLFGLSFVLQSLVFLKFFLEAMPFLVRTEALTLANVQLLPFSPQSFSSFVLPFMTGGHSAFFKTDMSMANAYIGLIAFVFLLRFIVKKLNLKTSILWGLGLFFLLVAMGDYFFLRAFLFHYVPMMDLFRYPALFRIFALVCFLLLAGLSLENYKSTLSSSANYSIVRWMSGALFTGLVIIFSYALSKASWAFPENLSAAALVSFFNKSTNSEMVLIQAPIQLFLLGLLFAKTYYQKGLSFVKFVLILVVVDLCLSVQLNTFLTINAEARLAPLQEKLDAFPDGFPIPAENLSTISHHGNKNYYPIWYNLNLLKKKVANNGYNNFKFRAYRTFKKQSEHLRFLEHPILFDSSPGLDTSHAMSSADVEINSFTPTKIEANVQVSSERELTLLQYFYPGWTVRLNGKRIEPFEKEDIFLAVNVPQGKHQLEYEFYPPHFLVYAGVSLLSLMVVVGVLIFSTGMVKSRLSIKP